MKVFQILLSLALVTIPCLGVKAEDPCAISVTEIQAGVFEADLGNVKVKTEAYNKLAKMKLISSLNEDWTSISTESDMGQITGYYGNGAEAKLEAHLVIRQVDDGFEWAIFKSDANGQSQKGTAYFYFNKKNACTQTTLKSWKSAVEKIIGDSSNVGVVNVSNDAL